MLLSSVYLRKKIFATHINQLAKEKLKDTASTDLLIYKWVNQNCFSCLSAITSRLGCQPIFNLLNA